MGVNKYIDILRCIGLFLALITAMEGFYVYFSLRSYFRRRDPTRKYHKLTMRGLPILRIGKDDIPEDIRRFYSSKTRKTKILITILIICMILDLILRNG